MNSIGTKLKVVRGDHFSLHIMYLLRTAQWGATGEKFGDGRRANRMVSFAYCHSEESASNPGVALKL